MDKYQKYMLTLIDKDSRDVILTGKVSTISWIKVWMKKLSESESISKKYEISWYPIETINSELLEAFDILCTNNHR